MAARARGRRFSGERHRKQRESAGINVFVGMLGDLVSKGLERLGSAFSTLVGGAAAVLAVRTGYHIPPEVAAGAGYLVGTGLKNVSGNLLGTVRSEWQKARTAKPGRHRAGVVGKRGPPSTGTTVTTAAPARKGSGMSLKDELLELLEAARGQYDAQDQTAGMIGDKAEEMTQNLVLVGSNEQAQAVDQAKNTAVEAIAQARAAAEKGLDDAIALVHQAIP